MTRPDVSCRSGEPIRNRVGSHGASGPWCMVIAASVVAALAMAAPTKSHAQGASFQGVGFRPNSTISAATGVNADGTVVVGGSGGQAFRWIDGTMTGLGVLFQG